MFIKPGKQTSCFRRTCDVGFAFLLIFYVLFDVLDVDGSNICRITIDGHHPVLTGIESDIRSDDLVESIGAHSAPIVIHRLVGHSPPSPATHLLLPLSPSTRFHGDRGCRSDADASDAPPDH
jgi:hypothetical protein